MSADLIFTALQDHVRDSAQGRDAARAGFLEWALTLPSDADAAKEAKTALRTLEARSQVSSAALDFLGYLRDASGHLPAPVRRGGAGARRRVLQ